MRIKYLLIICAVVVLAGISIVLLISNGCFNKPTGLLPSPTEFWLDSSLMGKPAFISHVKWDGSNYTMELEGSFLIGSRESTIKTNLKAKINADGRPQEVEYENQQPGAVTKISGKLQGDKFIVKSTSPDGRQEEKELPCPSGTVLADMSDMMAGVKLAKSADEVKLQVIDLDQIKVAEATYKIAKHDDKGFTVNFSRADMAMLSLTMQFDKQGEVLSAENPSLRLSIKRITAEQAKTQRPPALNIDALTYVKFSGQMAPHAHKSVIRMALGDMKLESAVATDAPGQTFKNNPDGSVTVTVVALNPPSKVTSEPIPDAVKPYLANTSMVPWTDSGIMEAAANVAPADADAWTVARLATSWVGAKLVDMRPERGMLTAKEALERGCGDCTEHSVLLAAILRARGIPARLAAGIAYIGGQFGFHMWNLAWIGGEWLPVDATFGYAPIPADRITMALVGADDKVENVAASLLPALGKLEITVEKSE